MGKIGRILPKPLWPLFEKKILDLQISFAKSLKVRKIFINTHHLSHQIRNFCVDKNVILLHEPILLGNGGCVHNLAKKENYSGRLLYLACDQFYFFEDQCWEKAYALLKDRAVLFGLKVKRKDPYNRLVVKGGILKKIEGPDSPSDLTFSGLGLIDLSKLETIEGPSAFFESVADFSRFPVPVIVPERGEYWDFGSAENYFESCFRLLKTTGGDFLEFCKKETVMDLKKIGPDFCSYGPKKEKNLLNFSNHQIKNLKGGKVIVLDSNSSQIDTRGLVYFDTFQNLKK
jgi:mannose-1-phosphate guanylyltransferase